MRSVSKFMLAAAAALPFVLWADMTGADPRLTGAPGDDQAACTSCHTGTRLNGGGGSVKIIPPGDAIYTPGVKQRMKVEVSDSAQRRWGFEFTAPGERPEKWPGRRSRVDRRQHARDLR